MKFFKLNINSIIKIKILLLDSNNKKIETEIDEFNSIKKNELI